MLADFFQLGPIPQNQMIGTYDLTLVILSYVVAIFASFIALDITGRLRDIDNTFKSRITWLCCGSLSMGAGIWSMHFIGMMAFKMDMPMGYDSFYTFMSMFIAVAASLIALLFMRTEKLVLKHFLLGGVILGIGIAAMHYTGMEAMKVSMNIHYQPSLFILSILIAIIASEAALWFAHHGLIGSSSFQFRMKILGALLLGAAICGMHYTGMYAAIFTPKSTATSEIAMNPNILSLIVALTTFFIMGLALIASKYKESLNQKLITQAHASGKAEVAANVLHNVGNVLNSLNVSSILIKEKVSKLPVETIQSIAELLQKNKANIGEYLTEDINGKNLIPFLTKLHLVIQKEQLQLSLEIDKLVNNIGHIKEIIATQQSLSSTKGLQQRLNIEDLIEESLIITKDDIDIKKIKIEKSYALILPIVINKSKFLQIIVNLIQNARDALIAFDATSKEIQISTAIIQNKVEIKVTDNGVGLTAENLKKVFKHGFTTKTTGHGYGLHSCMLNAHELGGTLKVESKGEGQGATFILELPYNHSI
jgi:NO-binding membrane sensor protein with MHYT domain